MKEVPEMHREGSGRTYTDGYHCDWITRSALEITQWCESLKGVQSPGEV